MNEQSLFFRHAPTWGTAVAACITAVLLVRMQPFYATADLVRFAFTCALELALLDLLTRVALMPSRLLLRLFGLVATAAIGCIYTAQLYSVWISGGLVPPIALANQEVTGLISFNGIYALLGGFMSAFCLHAFFSRNQPPRWNISQIATAFSAIALVYAGIVFHQPVARGIVVDSGEAPVSSFVRTVATYAGMNAPAQLSAAQLNKVRAEFLRDETYQMPFPPRYSHALPARPNFIVIFTEGMSARWMESYDGVHPGLMPNMDRLASESLVFTNYYNHTAATFRGLRGQLTSGHQQVDGYNKEGTGDGERDVSGDVNAVARASLADMLRGQGYSSMFFLSQQAFLNKMIDTLGFDRTLGRDYLHKRHLGGASSNRPKVLSDRDLFSAMLSELEDQPRNKPFFAAAYNFQTHAFLDGEHKYGDGGNTMLNRFHSYDRDIGEFVARFKASPLHENTVLIITADHATFPEPNVFRADPRVPTYFVDTIPMVMYWKGMQHNVVDVAGKNSLDLAPTVLSMVGAQYGRNLFLGCTLFETCALDRISNIDTEYILTAAGRSYTLFYLPEDEKKYFRRGKEMIERYKSMDVVISKH